MMLIDIVEMYVEGEVELLVVEVILGWCDQVFLVSKVYFWYGLVFQLFLVCVCSLKCLGIDWIDFYLLYWCGDVFLVEIVVVMEKLCDFGYIRYWGVSNFDIVDMVELIEVGGWCCVVNQIFYNLIWCGLEWDLLLWMVQCGIFVMVYSLVEQGWLVGYLGLVCMGVQFGFIVVQFVLVWVLNCLDMIVILKVVDFEYVIVNLCVVELGLILLVVDEFDWLFVLFDYVCLLEMI